MGIGVMILVAVIAFCAHAKRKGWIVGDVATEEAVESEAQSKSEEA